MAGKKVHISADGRARECVAAPGNCKLVHGETAEEAHRNNEKVLQAEAGGNVAAPTRKSSGGQLSRLSPTDQRTVKAHVDRGDDWDEYYTATDEKHFRNKDAPGSKYTDPSLTKVEDVVALAMEQRGGLDGDDRDKLIALGAKPSAFRDGNRYLMVNTPGTLGIKDSRDMKDDDLVEVTRTKPGTPVNLVRKVTQQDTTDYGVVVVTKDFDTGEPRVITTFPGTVTLSPKSPQLEALEGKTITVKQAREILGEDFHANTRVVSQEEVANSAPPAKPHPRYGFDTSRLSAQQSELVARRMDSQLKKIESHYSKRIATAEPDNIRRLKRDMDDAINGVYQQMSKL